MQVSQRVRFSVSSRSVDPSVLPVAGTGASHASKAFRGQVGGSTGRGCNFSQVVDPHPVKVSRPHSSSEIWILTDHPFNGLNLRAAAALGLGDTRVGFGLDLQHAGVRVGQFLKGLPARLLGL